MPAGLKIDRQTDVLAVIDVQPTFMPGGELPVAGGDAIVPVINRLLCDRFQRACATQDWHPADHASFASNHENRRPYETVSMPYGPQILWPDHAIQGTANAELHPGLETARIALVLRKGWRSDLDSYSAFFENDRTTSTGLRGWLLDLGIRRLFLAGLAADFCVAWTAEDAVRSGFDTVVIEDATCPIAMVRPDGHRSDALARERLTSLGVTFLRSAGLD